MEETQNKQVPILLWPFYAVWRFLTFVLSVVGRLFTAIVGFVLMFAGVTIALSVVGAPVGIPLAVLGFLLTVRALF